MHKKEFAVMKINLFFRNKNSSSSFYSKQFVGLEPGITGGKLAGNRKH